MLLNCSNNCLICLKRTQETQCNVSNHGSSRPHALWRTWQLISRTISICIWRLSHFPSAYIGPMISMNQINYFRFWRHVLWTTAIQKYLLSPPHTKRGCHIQNIFNVIDNQLSRCNIPWDKYLCFGSGNAHIMMGKWMGFWSTSGQTYSPVDVFATSYIWLQKKQLSSCPFQLKTIFRTCITTPTRSPNVWLISRSCGMNWM